MHDLDADALHQAGETAHDAVDDAAAVRLHLVEVERDAVDPDAERRQALARLVERMRRLHHRLRRDAPDVQAGAADAAEQPLLDAHDRRAELDGADRCWIAARTGPENREIAFDCHMG